MNDSRQGPVLIYEPCGCYVDHGIPYRCSGHALTSVRPKRQRCERTDCDGWTFDANPFCEDCR